MCECLLLAGIPSTPAPNSTLQHCYKFKKSLCPEAKVDRCKFRIAPFPCQSGCKLRTGPHAAPQNAEFSSIVNGLDIKSSILHSDEVEGALNWVSSLLALFGVAFAWGWPLAQILTTTSAPKKLSKVSTTCILVRIFTCTIMEHSAV